MTPAPVCWVDGYHIYAKLAAEVSGRISMCPRRQRG